MRPLRVRGRTGLEIAQLGLSGPTAIGEIAFNILCVLDILIYLKIQMFGERQIIYMTGSDKMEWSMGSGCLKISTDQ